MGECRIAMGVQLKRGFGVVMSGVVMCTMVASVTCLYPRAQRGELSRRGVGRRRPLEFPYEDRVRSPSSTDRNLLSARAEHKVTWFESRTFTTECCPCTCCASGREKYQSF
jgi:hypothetical protein